MFGLHVHKWSDPEGRYQTCLVCRKVRVVECAHTWIREGEITGKHGQVGVVQKCTRCGELKGVYLA